MRALSIRVLAAAVPLAVLGALLGARAADAPPLQGTYKLVFIAPFQEAELMLLDVKDVDGKASATVKESGLGVPKPKVTKAEMKGSDVSLTIESKAPDGRLAISLTFRGQFDDDGKEAKGTLKVQDNKIAALLVKTKATKLDQKNNQAVIQKYVQASREKDPKAKVKQLKAMIEAAPGSPMMDVVYVDLLQHADAAGLKAGEVKKVADEWINGARAFGDDMAAVTQIKALKALGGKKAYATLVLELATAADKALGPQASTEAKGDVALALADAAEAAGKADIAKEARARADKLQDQLDAEYHEKVPPFKPEPAPDRKAGTRVVLMELFTGAQCPPCVAADVAFDALNTTYKPKDVITLQYHLHIPGPDPLTNKDSVARQEYYEVGSTPTTLFNGGSKVADGGPMDRSKIKYDEFRKIIDDELGDKARAAIDLKADRKGDTITITAEAKGEKLAKDAQPRLRLVLVEKAIRYVGGNRLRFHHHVVRAMPGGAEGKELADGKATVEATVNLADVRKGIDEYLAEYAEKTAPFPNALPAIGLKDLAVVAYVQDDADKSVLHAVIADLGGDEH